MKHKSPKQLRKKKRNPYLFGDLSDMLVFRTELKGSRADRLPPFEEYNPNRVHVARRRRAWKDHTSFPRGWRFNFEERNDPDTSDGWSAPAGQTAS